jgi:PAS domain S-box-containing protein
VRYTFAYAEFIAAYLTGKYQGVKLDAIYVTDDAAMRFALSRLPALFPNVPVFFSGVNDYDTRYRLDQAHVTGVFERKEIGPNLKLMRRLDPDLRSLLVVGDDSETDQAIRREVLAELEQHPKLQVRFLSDDHIETLIPALRNSPERFVCLATLGAVKDAAGRTLTLPEIVAAIVRARPFVIFSMEDAYLMDGVLGGFVTSGLIQGDAAADMILQYWSGTPITAIPPIEISPNQYMFDARELERTGLELPPEVSRQAVILHRRTTFHERHLTAIVRTTYVLGLLFLGTLGLAFILLLRKNRQIAESVHRHRVLFEESPDAYLLIDNDLVAECNRAAELMLGGQRNQILGQSLASLSPVSQPGGMTSAEGAKSRVADALRAGSVTFEWVHQRLDGTEFWAAVSIARMTIRGRPLLFVSMRNITEQVRHRTVNSARLHLMEFATAHSLDELIEETLNKTEQLTQSSIGFYHLIEENKGTLTLQNWSTRTKQEFCRASGKGMHYAIAEAGVWVDCIHQRKPVIHNDYPSLTHRRGMPDGHAALTRELVVPVVRGDHITAVLGVGNKPTAYTQEDIQFVSLLADLAWEIVERKRAEELRAQIETQLRQVQKMEAVGHLAGGIAHDFNNILAALMINLDLSRQTTGLPPETEDSLAAMAPLIQRAATLTRQLLLFARRSVMQQRVIDLNALLGDLLNMLRRLIREDIRLAFQGAREALWIHADPGMIEQVVTNLVVNARDALPAGGRIDIRAHQLDIDAAHVEAHPETRPGTFACLSVADTGTGMQPTTLQRIFEPFFTTKDVGKGTGLGLPTVQGIVQQHQGWIEVESAPDKGSTFRIYLPTVQPPHPEPQPSPSAPPAPGGTRTLLVVEDEVLVRDAIVRTLQHQGYRVLAAAHGQEALHHWETNSETIDLLITDVVMPEGLGGFELAEQLRRTRPGLRIVFMSGYNPELMSRGFAASAGTRFLQKPFSPRTLLVEVHRLLREPEPTP